MKFGKVPLEKAEGAILAHSLAVAKGIVKKGRPLTADDLAALAQAGHRRVIVALLEGGDLDENAAATRLAEAVAGENITLSAAATGRVNLFAEAPGVAVLDADRINRINRIHEALTVATTPPFALVQANQAVATVKVITFGLPEKRVERAAALARDNDAPIRVAAFRPRRVGLLQTSLPGRKESTLDKTRATTEARLRALGSALEQEIRCDHDEEAVEAAIRELGAAGCEILLILGASAISDRRDVVPTAIERAGGKVEHFGMPVDPGNLTLLGSLNGATILGLPGSARSPRLHGFDWVLERIVADIPITGTDLAAMGVGGLLKDIPGRPMPRERAAPPPDYKRMAHRPKIAAIILAAGRSRRMGPVNKLLADVAGQPMIARVADIVLASAVGPVLVILGHEGNRVEAALAGRDLQFVANPDYAEGLSTSLKAGIGALPDDVDGVLVCLGDMPRVTADAIDQLITAFDPSRDRCICVPVFDGKRGNPVLWARRFFTEMQAVAGDVGARHLIGEYEDQVVEVDMTEDGVLIDVDSPDALAAL